MAAAAPKKAIGVGHKRKAADTIEKRPTPLDPCLR